MYWSGNSCYLGLCFLTDYRARFSISESSSLVCFHRGQIPNDIVELLFVTLFLIKCCTWCVSILLLSTIMCICVIIVYISMD